MENQNYSATIAVALSPSEVFDHVNDVSRWWCKVVDGVSSTFEGKSAKLGDEFIIRSGDRHYSKQKLVEVIPGKKMVWLVTDSLLNWLENDKTEWNGTKMTFEIMPKGDMTELRFTHEGLIPQVECYDMCAMAWDMFITESLYNFMTENIAAAK